MNLQSLEHVFLYPKYKAYTLVTPKSNQLFTWVNKGYYYYCAGYVYAAKNCVIFRN